MTVKSFGTLLIGIGIFIVFAFFVFSSWRIDLDFMGNIRYAILLEFGEADRYSRSENLIITLGQGLLLPFFIIGIGFIIKHDLIGSEAVTKILPFLTNNPDK